MISPAELLCNADLRCSFMDPTKSMAATAFYIFGSELCADTEAAKRFETIFEYPQALKFVDESLYVGWRALIQQDVDVMPCKLITVGLGLPATNVLVLASRSDLAMSRTLDILLERPEDDQILVIHIRI